MTIADLLTQSRTLHRQAQEALRRHDAAGAQALFTQALALREQAHDADPTHADLAWLIDLKSSMGVEKRDKRVSMAEIALQQHDGLMAYYQEQTAGLKVIERQVNLGPDLGKQTLRMVRPAKIPDRPKIVRKAEINALISVPIDKDGQPKMQVEESLAYQQLMKEQGR